MKSLHQQRVEDFMLQARQEVLCKPTLIDGTTRVLRARLIFEEAIETINALGCYVWGLDEDCYIAERENGNLVQIADGCADLSVVIIGTLSACGIPDEPLLKLVDENNLAKFGPGGYLREDGKWIKPPNHRPPDIEALLKSLQN